PPSIPFVRPVAGTRSLRRLPVSHVLPALGLAWRNAARSGNVRSLDRFSPGSHPWNSGGGGIVVHRPPQRLGPQPAARVLSLRLALVGSRALCLHRTSDVHSVLSLHDSVSVDPIGDRIVRCQRTTRRKKTALAYCKRVSAGFLGVGQRAVRPSRR